MTVRYSEEKAWIAVTRTEFLCIGTEREVKRAIKKGQFDKIKKWVLDALAISMANGYNKKHGVYC